MKSTGNTCNLLLVILLFVLLINSCGGPRKAKEERKKDQTGYDERNYDPLEFPGDRIIVPEKYPRQDEIKGQLVPVDNKSMKTGDTAGSGRSYGGGLTDTLNNQVFRIQLVTCQVYGEARNEVIIAEEMFDQPVYMDYEVPYYKVRVGDFPDQLSAEEYRQKVKASGYSDAWVVVVNINIMETVPLYESQPDRPPGEITPEETFLEDND